MSIILSLILFVTGLSMFYIKNPTNKLGLLYLTIICLSAIYPPFKIPYLTNASEFISFCLLASEWKNVRIYLRSTKRTILYSSFIILLIGSIITWINSPNYSDFWGLITIIKTDFLGKYLLFFYPFLCIKDKNSLKQIIPIIYWAFTILFIFAVINLILHYNYFVDWALKTGGTITTIMEDMGGKYSNSLRFRVSSMFPNAFNYGFTCIGILFLFIYFKHLKLISNSKFLLVSFYSIFGIITCGCRTVLLTSVIAFCIYTILYFKLIKSIRIGIISIMLLFILSTIFPSISELIDKMLSIFSYNSNIEGSSIEMREEQWLATLFWLNDKYLCGQGYGFIRLNLEFGTENFAAEELRGLENVTMVYLLERGIIGVITFYSIYIILLIFLVKNLKRNKLECSIGISILIASIVFANATGLLLSYLITYLNIGILLNIIYTKKLNYYTCTHDKFICNNCDL